MQVFQISKTVHTCYLVLWLELSPLWAGSPAGLAPPGLSVGTGPTLRWPEDHLCGSSSVVTKPLSSPECVRGGHCQKDQPWAEARPLSLSWQGWASAGHAAPQGLSQDTRLVKNQQNLRPQGSEALICHGCEVVSPWPEVVPVGEGPEALRVGGPLCAAPAACSASPATMLLLCFPDLGGRASSSETHYSLSLSAFL